LEKGLEYFFEKMGAEQGYLNEEGVFFVEKPSLLFEKGSLFAKESLRKGSGIFFRKKGCGAKLFKGVGLPGFCVKEVKG